MRVLNQLFEEPVVLLWIRVVCHKSPILLIDSGNKHGIGFRFLELIEENLSKSIEFLFEFMSKEIVMQQSPLECQEQLFFLTLQLIFK